ncbi:MAG: hypothetical protein COV52_05190 [Gammaproteobacteria bacterium CG11_big_fil_rev_8_21_14_0_20_46_22]|nr:MAG: hypothetical protein COW05_10065 [Gammaproteobacteria bacterium CG12_big_fil_rev_8_21_14_0_65_46_12]PIR11191.1 MAG: hypothetical protein COV52_05190 [Gammaproteobacteria bacterium CG11_big_fil_rev_8_21_14_0_20_46_22]
MKYLNIIFAIVVAGTALMLSACSSPVIIPLNQGGYRVVADGFTNTEALSQAKKYAEQQCQSEHKHLVVDNYHFVMNNDRHTAKENGSASQATLSALNPENSHIVLNFKCVGK